MRQLDPENKTFCILPWVHLHTWPNGQVYQCCVTDHRLPCGNAKNNTLEEIWHNDYMTDMRTRMLAGERHTSCERCYMLEENNLGSFRESSNRNFAHHIPEALEAGAQPEFKMVYWDFRFSNLCNFKCRMCGHDLSSHWYDDHAEIMKQYGYQPQQTRVITINENSQRQFREYIDEFIDHVEEINFAGGEPLIMDEHYEILEELVRRGRTNVTIRYNTNLSKLRYKQWDVLQLWSHFKHRVQIFASLDATGEIAEYVRSGTRWDTIIKNVRAIVAQDAKSLGISATVQLFTVFDLPHLVNTLIDAGVKPNKILVNNVLSNPACYSIQLLPEELKEQVQDRLLTHLETLPHSTRQHLEPQYTGIIEFMMNRPANTEQQEQELWQKTKQLDSLRGEDVFTITPELHEWLLELKARYEK